MIKLKNIEILKYKSFTTPQSINIEEDNCFSRNE
jgi:hypothetical protein